MTDKETVRSREIADGRRVREILEDPVFQKALDGLKRRAIADFAAAKSPDELRKAQVKYQITDELTTELTKIVDAGYRADVERQREAAKAR